jgi:hypothetical protein
MQPFSDTRIGLEGAGGDLLIGFVRVLQTRRPIENGAAKYTSEPFQRLMASELIQPRRASPAKQSPAKKLFRLSPRGAGSY